MMLALIMMTATLAATEEPAVIASPPHLIRIVDVPALVQLPNGGGALLLPVGSEFGVERYSYKPHSRTTSLRPVPLPAGADPTHVFGNSFEATQ